MPRMAGKQMTAQLVRGSYMGAHEPLYGAHKLLYILYLCIYTYLIMHGF